MPIVRTLLLTIAIFGSSSASYAECHGYAGVGGACYTGPGGGLSDAPGGGASAAPGGGLFAGPGGGLYTGPGGGMYRGAGGGLFTGPGGGAYTGPGGGAYAGGPTPDGYKGPWSPCVTGVKDADWTKANCTGLPFIASDKQSPD